jgi:DNA-binding LacI/PurR family transcriptional regulator
MTISHLKRATLNDVAQVAGTSYATVSRVINNNPEVAEETRQRVLHAIQELNYVPNRAARSLIRGRTFFLQMIVANAASSLLDIVTTVKEVNYGLGFTVLSSPTNKDEFRQVMREVVAEMVDGFFIDGPEFDYTLDEMNEVCMGRPFVHIGSNPSPNIPAVMYDQKYGATLALQHLFDYGHRQIAEISGAFAYYDGRIRHETYLEMMTARGLTPGPWLASEYFSVEDGYSKCLQLLDRSEKFTALYCGNDYIAIGAMRALTERGLRVPEDVSVIGFDNTDLAAYVTPPLSTIRQERYNLYTQAVKYLLAMIENADTPRYRQVMPPELVVRQSTAAPR